MSAGGGEGDAGGRGGDVAAVDADVEAGLLELLFDVDLALVDERLEVGPHPCDLGDGEAVLGDVDGLAGEVRRGGAAGGGRGVGVAALEPLLELDGAHGGVDLQRQVEAVVMVAGEGGEEVRSSGAREAAVLRQTVVDAQGPALRQGDELMTAAQLEQVGVVAHAVQAVAVCHLVLVEQNVARTVERLRDHEVAAAVVQCRDAQRGQNDRRRSLLFDGRQRVRLGDGAEDAVDVDKQGGVAGGRPVAGCSDLGGLTRCGKIARLPFAGMQPRRGRWLHPGWRQAQACAGGAWRCYAAQLGRRSARD